jgi:trimeric autotransporter adhesin
MNQRLLIVAPTIILALVAGAAMASAGSPDARPDVRRATVQGPGAEAAPLVTPVPPPAAFTYQGQLKQSGSPANGQYDFQLSLYDAPTGGSLVSGPVTATLTVTNGLFTATPDFGAAAFQGSARWLEIAVRPSGGGPYTTLSPRQPLTPSPYAVSVVPGAVVSGTNSSAMLTLLNTGSGSALSSSGSDTGVYGASSGFNGKGVYGENTASFGWGGYFSSNGIGVVGTSSAANSTGVYGLDGGSDGYGVLGRSNGTNGRGVYGTSSAADTVGVYGDANNGSGAKGVYGTSTNGYGVYGQSTGGLGVFGQSNSNTGVYGQSANGYGVDGQSTGSVGVRGRSDTNTGVRATSNTGIGLDAYSAGGWGVHAVSDNDTGLYATSDTGLGIDGRSTTNTGIVGSGGTNGVQGNTSNAGASGVYGQNSSSGGYGVAGRSNGATGIGVYGEGNGNVGVRGASTGGYGGYFTSNTGIGLEAQSTSSWGVHATSNSDTALFATSNTGVGIDGRSTTNTGISGYSTNGTGVNGGSGDPNNGVAVRGVVSSTNAAVLGINNAVAFGTYTSMGVKGVSNAVSTDATGVYGFGYGKGVAGESSGGYGVYGNGLNYGVYGASGNNAIYGFATRSTAYAGYFFGNVHITGTCCGMAEGYSQIDHPLDPANKLLNQSFVQSPEMLDVYNGNATLDATGEAWVQVPDWFEALTRDFRYQLTPIGAPGPNLYVAQELKDHRFKIAGGQPGMKISWLVTGIRRDPYATAHPLQVEQEKQGDDRGNYLYPTEHGQPESKGLDYNKHKKAEQPADSPGARK